VIKHHSLITLGLQQAAHGHSEAPVARDDDPGAVINDVGIPYLSAAGKKRLDEFFISDHQQRRQGHGYGDNCHQHRSMICEKKAQSEAERDQNESEFAALRQREGKMGAVGAFHAEDAGNDIENRQLQNNKAEDKADDPHGIGHEQVEVNAGPHRHEEDRQQEALEGIEIHFKLMAVFTFCQHHPGEEGSKGSRQAHELHHQGDADNNEQGKGHENLSDSRLRDIAEQRPHEVAASQHDGRNSGEHAESLGPSRKVSDEAGTFVSRRVLNRQQRQERQHGDNGNILKQQNRKRGLAGKGLELAAFIQALNDDCR